MKTFKNNLMSVLVLVAISGGALMQASIFDDIKKRAEEIKADAAKKAQELTNKVVVASTTAQQRDELLKHINDQLMSLVNRRTEIENNIRQLLTQKFDENQMKALKASVESINNEIKNIEAMFETAAAVSIKK